MRRTWLATTSALLIAPAAAAAATTIGSTLANPPSGGSTCGTATFMDTVLGSGTLLAPFSGVVVRWRVSVATPTTMPAYKLRIIHPAGGSKYQALATGSAVAAPSVGVNVVTLPSPIPIQAGDTIGIDCAAGAPTPYYTSPSLTGTTYAYFAPPLVDDAPASSPNNQLAGEESLINADVVGVPVIGALAPPSGTTAGAAPVTITGSRLADVTAVTFGGAPAAAFTVVSDTQVTAIAPAHAAGAVDIRATDVAGTSAIVPAGTFTYTVPAPPPIVSPPPLISPPPPPPPVVPVAPVLSALKQSRSVWRRGARLAVVARATTSKPVGTTFSLKLSAAAKLTLSFVKRSPGRRVGGHCVAPGTRNAKQPHCTRSSKPRKLFLAGHAGSNRITFQGRLSARTKLTPGAYALSVTAVDAAGQHSNPATLHFTIAR